MRGSPAAVLFRNRPLDPLERLLKPVQRGVQCFRRHGRARYHISQSSQPAARERSVDSAGQAFRGPRNARASLDHEASGDQRGPAPNHRNSCTCRCGRTDKEGLFQA
ncbi:hypothetical protein Saro_1969 [Novosphingobium aromaticivorans DSM 12444]|uniref:Uncharacterized protein n=1 Tax=Novosphingobium aromaticivorans (strain ATCC 700278 / DSM 12444 / CCUG 56034 / CIP 105152 / NBRC 16084 / F199) TaxID=279238 RepID=Q2G6W4_NOVAD|nr:hypothetical protein Saro_1969 [Novosphingobium aromaticivorans DSM 12444]